MKDDKNNSEEEFISFFLGSEEIPEVEEIPLFSNIDVLTVNLKKGNFQAFIGEDVFKGELGLFGVNAASEEQMTIKEFHLIGLVAPLEPEQYKQFIKQNVRIWTEFIGQIMYYGTIQELFIAHEIPREFAHLLKLNIYQSPTAQVQKLDVHASDFSDEFNDLSKLEEITFTWDAPIRFQLQKVTEYTSGIIDRFLKLAANNSEHLVAMRFSHFSHALFANIMFAFPLKPSLELQFLEANSNEFETHFSISNNRLTIVMKSPNDNTILRTRDLEKMAIKQVDIRVESLTALAPAPAFFKNLGSQWTHLDIKKGQNFRGDILPAFVNFLKFNGDIIIPSLQSMQISSNADLNNKNARDQLAIEMQDLIKTFVKMNILFIRTPYQVLASHAEEVCPYVGCKVWHKKNIWCDPQSPRRLAPGMSPKEPVAEPVAKPVARSPTIPTLYQPSDRVPNRSRMPKPNDLIRAKNVVITPSATTTQRGGRLPKSPSPGRSPWR